MTRYLLGLVMHALAALAGSAAGRLDRAAWSLHGGDPVEQHYAHTIRDAGRRVHAGHIASAPRAVATTTERGAPPLPRPELAVQHRPVADIPAVPTLAYIEVLDDVDAARRVGQLLGRYYGSGPTVAACDADDLLAMLARDGVVLARRSG